MTSTDPTDAEQTKRSEPGWRQSSFSQGGDQTCVDVAFAGVAIVIRDSKDPAGPRLFFTAREWQVFLQGVRAGEFDPPSSTELSNP